jgi:hypothetical protein
MTKRMNSRTPLIALGTASRETKGPYQPAAPDFGVGQYSDKPALSAE